VGTTPAACYHRGMRVGFAIVVAVSATLPAAAGPRPGHAVRIERAHPVGTPRLCVMQSGSNALCLGPAPETGDAIEFVDETHYLGTARVTHVESKCKTDEPNVWQVQAAVESELASISGASFAMGVIGVTLDPRAAHVETLDDPALTTGMSAVKAVGVDTQGSGHSAVAFVLGQCDTTGGPTFCFDVWTDREGHGLERTQHAVLSEDCL
jgi:hypothetical protein